jgi:hypothetical protein
VGFDRSIDRLDRCCDITGVTQLATNKSQLATNKSGTNSAQLRVELNNFPPTMEQDALFHCHDCQCKKPKDQFKQHQKATKYAKQGDPMRRCLPCAAKEHDRRQNKKRKRDNEGSHPSQSHVEPCPVIPIEQFTQILCELARGHDLNCRTHVSMQGMTEEGQDVFNLIVKHVWDITGFRFMYGALSAWGTMAKQSHCSLSFRRQIIQKNGAVWNMYECCQSENCSSNRKKPRPEEGKQTRDT